MKLNRRGARATLAAAAVLSAAALALSGCSSAGGGASGTHPLTIGMPDGPQTHNNNPYIPTSSAATLGYTWLMYEPLVQQNPTEPDQKGVPWLAKSWSFSPDYKTVKLTARSGVTWSDGKPFTADDIAYTFDLIKAQPAFNGNALPIESATASGDTATITFGSSQYVNQTKILGTFIVPKHIWSTIKDPTTWANNSPVGTGPYTLKTWTQQTMTFQPNSDYWGGKPPVPTVQFTTYTDNNAQLAALLSGSTQWSYVAVPNLEKAFTSKSKDFHTYMPTGLGIDALFLNAQKAPFDDVAVRKAVNMVIDHDAVHTQGYSGFKAEVDNVTGLPMPAGESFLADQYKNATSTVDVAGAKKVLTDAGYTFQGGKLIGKDGKQVTFTMTDPAGWSDYLASLQIIADNVKKIGIAADVQTQTQDSWTTALATGDFQASLHWTNTGATPWDIYSDIMDGTQYKALGQTATWNFGRFQSTEATNALAQYATTTDDATRQQAMTTLENVFVDQVPAIPLAAGPMGAEWSSKYWTGFPTKDDPYAPPQPTQPNLSQVLMKLKPSS